MAGPRRSGSSCITEISPSRPDRPGVDAAVAGRRTDVRAQLPQVTFELVARRQAPRHSLQEAARLRLLRFLFDDRHVVLAGRTHDVRRLRIFGQRDKLEAERSKGA
jgi:hypothetical protein